MRLSPALKKIAGTCWLAAVFAHFGWAQTFVTNGIESGITGPMAGEQLHPHSSLNSGGGFMVWDDNVSDGRGLGIGAVALDSSLSRVGSPFRVNQMSSRDQERPQVALLGGGGALFVWQGGKANRHHIYARQLSPSNTWATADILVSAAPTSQVAPAAAALENGNVVIVYDSFNQVGASSMHDIYARIYNPTGGLGSEFLINQFTDSNQRNAAVAPLISGGFVVAWVSEGERNAGTELGTLTAGVDLKQFRASVDIFARVFDANGAPVANELLVNVSSNLCNTPTVASAADGSFMVAWTQWEPDRGWGLESPQPSGSALDVYGRAFSSAAAPLSEPVLVNSYTNHDQYEPKISASGTEYLVVWSSFSQDGSVDGVYGQWFNVDGSKHGGEFRVNTAVLHAQKQPSVTADNYGRFLAVWTSFVGGRSSFDLYAQKYSLPNFTPPTLSALYQPPAADPWLTNDIPDDVLPPTDPNSPVARGLRLDFPVALGTGTVAHVFSQAKGTYSGIFYESNGVSVASAGYITATLNDKGSYSGKLLSGGRSYPFSGLFNSSGKASATVSRNGQRALRVTLFLDTDDNILFGSVKDQKWTADLMADRQVFNRAKAPATAFAGSYTSGFQQVSNSLAADGFAAVKVDLGGTVQVSGAMSDGSKVVQKTGLSGQGIWPLYASLYSGKGCVLGWVTVTNNSSGLAGEVVWARTGAFSNALDIVGGPYRRPVGKSPALSWSGGKGEVVLSGGILKASPTTNVIQLNTHITLDGGKSSGSKLALNITPATGLFRGTLKLSSGNKPMQIQGALLQEWDIGAGFFFSPGGNGQILLTPSSTAP